MANQKNISDFTSNLLHQANISNILSIHDLQDVLRNEHNLHVYVKALNSSQWIAYIQEISDTKFNPTHKHILNNMIKSLYNVDNESDYVPAKFKSYYDALEISLQYLLISIINQSSI
jgi:hypothetical protein